MKVWGLLSSDGIKDSLEGQGDFPWMESESSPRGTELFRLVSLERAEFCQ